MPEVSDIAPGSSTTADIRVVGNVVGSSIISGNGNTVTVVYAAEVHKPARTARDNPYRGLDAFDETSADLYFGRTQLSSSLIAH